MPRLSEKERYRKKAREEYAQRGHREVSEERADPWGYCDVPAEQGQS